MKYPKITIITPSLNQGNYLENTIQSILNQGYPNLEYMIIDGGSTDDSIEIIKRNENKLSYWISEKDSGQSHAINKGLARATGDIITWINSDDQLLPNVLSKVAGYFDKNKNIGLIHGKTILYNNSGFSEIRGAEDNNLRSRYLSGMPFPQPSSFFRREVIEEHGSLNQDLHFGMDYDLLCKIALNYDILKVDDILSNYLLHSSSKSETAHEGFAKDWAVVFSKVVRTLDNTDWIVKELKLLNLYISGKDKYSAIKIFNKEELTFAFLYFVYNQIIFNYQALDLKITYKLTKYLRSNYRDFFDDNNLSQEYWRSKFIVASPIIGLLRKLKK